MTPEEYMSRHCFYMKKGLNLDGKGLELGASYNPICPKKDGYNIEILDVLSREDLISHYSKDPYVSNLIDNIEEVDYIFDGRNYIDIVGGKV